MALLKKKTAAKKASKSAAKKAAVKKAAPKKTATKKSAPKKKAVPEGLPEQMLDAALKVLDERQAQDIVAITLTGRSALADYMIIASGKTSRQVAALADHLDAAFHKLGARRITVEGKEEGNWVLVDAGDIIVHLFRPEVRKYYDLDSIWAKKPPRK
ncbi:MAG: ribosome silencing factor [Alphaproteobacteria bacterium]|nr:ribosome silencing factor [Alphaproteobacteria bacterium]